MASDEALGSEHEVTCSGGRLRYRERGEGPPVVFVHGALVNGDLWREVVPGLVAAGLRTITPDWPFGAHSVPVPDADLSPPGVAAMIAEFLERLDLRGVTLVANDTGGGLVQVLLATSGATDRIARVVLTPSDCFEKFFPFPFSLLSTVARIPGAMWVLGKLLRTPAATLPPLGYHALTRRRLPASTVASFTGPARRDPGIRADLARFLSGIRPRHTLAAAEQLHRFDGPVLLAWAIEDRLFPISLAHRLAQRFRDAEIVGIEDAATFVPVDAPGRLGELILGFVRDHDPAAATRPATSS